MTRRAPLRRTSRLEPGAPPARRTPLERNAGLGAVSAKQARQNRERRAMADRRWPDRRDGTVMCYVPGCPLPADDLNEILPRGRGGSITDEANTIPTCRAHNEELTKSPAWAYRAGLLKHDGACCRGRDVCSQYTEGGEAA